MATQARHNSVNACIACWSKKRKCDRLFPACSRCIAAGSLCAYCDGSSCSTSFAQVIQPTTYSPEQANNGIRLLARVETLRTHPPEAGPELDMNITFEVCSLLSELGISIAAVVNQYWTSIHHWLPLFQPQSFEFQVSTLANKPCAESALLLVYIFLVSFRSTLPATSDTGCKTTLYYTCKSIFLRMHQITIREQVAIIKSGILLAAFEIGEQLLSNASQTLATAANVWRKASVNSFSVNAPTSSEAKDLQSCWWAIHMLDRVLCLFSDIRRVSVIAETEPGHDFTHQNHLDCPALNVNLIYQPGSDYSDAQHRGYTATHIQAVGLLDDLVSNRIESIGERQLMDSILQQRLSESFDRKDPDWVLQYSIVVILLLALVELHGKILSTSPDMVDKTVRERSQLALKATLQMTRDITLMDHKNNLARVPLTAVLLLKKAIAVSSLLDSSHQPGKQQILADLEGSLQRARARWRIAN